ncbi:MAG: hypothetical protein CME06_07425 [Gemmatimonadetes bacterium]|nr:hypothetical protein [Gemmatimonadota bacterium]
MLATEQGDTVVVVDVSAPLEPEPLAAYAPVLERDRVVDVAIDETLGIVLTMRGRLELLDLTLPSLPGLLGRWETGWDSGVSVVAGEEGAIYLGTVDSTGNKYWGRHALQVVDASDPLAPILVSTHDLGDARLDSEKRHELVLRDRTLVMPYARGLTAWDLTDPLRPKHRWTRSSLFVDQLALAATDSFAVMLGRDSWEDSTRVSTWHLSDGRELPTVALAREEFDGDLAAAGDHVAALEEGEPMAGSTCSEYTRTDRSSGRTGSRTVGTENSSPSRAGTAVPSTRRCDTAYSIPTSMNAPTKTGGRADGSTWGLSCRWGGSATTCGGAPPTSSPSETRSSAPASTTHCA